MHFIYVCSSLLARSNRIVHGTRSKPKACHSPHNFRKTGYIQYVTFHVHIVQGSIEYPKVQSGDFSVGSQVIMNNSCYSVPPMKLTEEIPGYE